MNSFVKIVYKLKKDIKTNWLVALGKLDIWSRNNFIGVIVFNLALITLMLLHSAGYFAPYLPLTINIIFLISMILMKLILSANSKFLFIISLFFLLLTGFFKLVNIEIWAERSAIYSFEAISVGVILLLIE